MNEKKYLKWYNKLGYGLGGVSSTMVYTLVSTFVMLYMTNAVGLNAGVVGTLIMFAKFADGISDVIFGNIIDHTHTKMGRARPWMLYAYIGNVISTIAIFMVPSGWGDTARYAYFFITYVLMNAVFYTASNIAYTTLTSLITRNGNERVQLGSISFIFNMAGTVFISSATVNLSEALGGGAAGWRNVAILYSVIGLIANTLSVFMVKELPPEHLETQKTQEPQKDRGIGLWASIKLLVRNRYYICIVLLYMLYFLSLGITNGAGAYYMMYVLGDSSLLGSFSLAANVPIIIGLTLTPFLVQKSGSMYKVDLVSFILCTVFKLLFVIVGYMQNLPLMLLFSALSGFFISPLAATVNALVAAAAEYTFLKTGYRIDGAVFSCSSLGSKIGAGLGSSICGWLLAAGGFDASLAVQSSSCISMLNVMYLWIPLVIGASTAFIMAFMNVEKANRKLRESGK